MGITVLGNIRWKGATIYLRGGLAGEHVGIRKRDEQFYEVYYGRKLIDVLDRFSLRLV